MTTGQGPDNGQFRSGPPRVPLQHLLHSFLHLHLHLLHAVRAKPPAPPSTDNIGNYTLLDDLEMMIGVVARLPAVVSATVALATRAI